MITFLDENDVEYGALATIKATNAVNGERSLTGTIASGDYVLSNIECGWRLRFDDEYYVVTYAKPIDEGRDVQVEFDAVHQFFWDFDKSSVYDQLADGSHTFVAYLDFIFKNSGYSYTVDSALNVYAFEKQSFGFKKRLTLFNDIVTSTGVEFQVNGKVVRILEKVGTDLSTVVRKNFNMNELTIEKNIGDFVTYQKGFGAYFDEEDHSKGRLEVEYTSPLASVYGKLEAEPFVDERYSQSSSLLAALKENVDNSYSISVSLDMEDLTRAGYKYKQPIAGDYIMAINETLGFKEKIRIVSFTSEYDVAGQLIKHTVTCNDIGSVKKLSASYTHTQHQAANAEANANTAYEFANKALISADGKNTNYYGDSFPVDNPKGTLKTGDLLFLTVGDTVKQYYWNGADWVINPVLDDVEAFKEQIADELKDVPNREEFENKIAEELATSKAEIETQIETAKTQAESNAKEYADTINQETAKVAELANAAADEIKADLVNVKNNLTDTSLVANNVKAEVDAAKQDLANVTSDLNTAKQDLTNHAQQLQTQANAQTELTRRVTSVETTANGTKTTVNELSKTVDSNMKNITSVTARTKIVEDDLTNTKTTLTQVQTTANSASQKTATLETGLDGLNAKFDNLKIGGANLLLYSADPSKAPSGYYSLDSAKKTSETYNGSVVYKVRDIWGGLKVNLGNLVDRGLLKVGDVLTYSVAMRAEQAKPIQARLFIRYTNQSVADSPTGKIELVNLTADWQYVSVTFTVTAKMLAENTKVTYLGWELTSSAESGKYAYYACNKIERGNIATDYSPNEADLEQKVAEYKQTADQNYASLQTTVQNLDGTVKQNKSEFDQTASQIKSSISAVEGKIPTEIGAVNLFKGSRDFSGTGWIGSAGVYAEDYKGVKIFKKNSMWGGRSQEFEAKTGEEYVFSAYVKSSAKTDRVTFYLPHPSNQPTAVGFVGFDSTNRQNDVSFDLTDKYKRIAIKIKITKDGWIAPRIERYNTDAYLFFGGYKLERGNIATDWTPAPEDTISQISSLSSQIQQTADGMTLLATKTELNTAKSDLQSGITTATNKANSAQNTADSAVTKANSAQSAANNNAQTISTHTTQISALNTGLQAKVSQSDFNTLSGRVTTAENNITAKANELSSKISSVEGKIPTSIGGTNLLLYSVDPWKAPSDYYQFDGVTKTDKTLNGSVVYKTNTAWSSLRLNLGKQLIDRRIVKIGEEFTYSIWMRTDQTPMNVRLFARFLGQSGADRLTDDIALTNEWQKFSVTFKITQKMVASQTKLTWFGFEQTTNAESGKYVYYACNKLERGNIATGYSPAPEDTATQISSLSSEFKQTTDAIKASVQSLDNNTVKSSSLTINADGIVMKAGKSTTDVANAIGSYFAVNQNAINLFSDKINVKGSMIVNGAITSDKIASKSINTAHLNGKIITADVISSNAVTADAIKAGAVTTDKMSANSINGDRIAAGTLDAAKIKAGSITASQIASDTITSNQIKAGGISSANIAAGAITGDKIAAGAIDANKIAANAITANMIRGGQLNSTNGATVFDLNAGTLTFNNNVGYIQRVASDKVFEITTHLSTSSGSQEFLTSAFNIRKSDNSRQAGVKFTLYNTVENKPTAEAKMNADALILYDSQNTRLFSVHGKSTFAGGINFQGWGDIPIAKIHGGLVVNDIGIGNHMKPLLAIVEELCKKAGIMWI